MANVDDAQTAKQLERVRRYQEILNDFGSAASDTRQLKQLIQVACVQAARGIGIKHTKVLRYRPGAGDLLIEAGVGWNPGVVGHTKLGIDISSPPGRTLQSRQAVQVDDLPNDPQYRYSPVLREHGIVSVLNMPIVVEGTIWGVLEVDAETPHHFGRDDVVFLYALANQLGLALVGMLRQKDAEDAAAQALREAEQQRVLMRELVHRDKNDFQMVVSMLLLEMGKQHDPDAVRVFEHIIDRVLAVSMVHDQLAMRPGRQTVDIAVYLEALCGNLRHRSVDIEIETRLDNAELTRERAVSLGLITNELVTNAIKHAFPNGKGTVWVKCSADEENGQGCLVVADNGVGTGPPRPGSSGLSLVKSLAQQIGGTFEQVPQETGTMFRVCFLLVR
jgi:two-component system, sensor histidine kinase PdtaS